MADTSSPVRSEQELIATYEAALAVATELDLTRALQRLVDLARTVVPARYAALGVADDQGVITEFITSGITPAQRAILGELPQGHGLLGTLIRDRTPLMVPDISQDPRSVGFPPHHPSMKTLLGVPILLADRVLGNLYLTERVGGEPFTNADLQTLKVFAAHAATAIDRAQLFVLLAESRQQAEEQRDQIRAILNSLPTAVLILRASDGKVEIANPAASALIFEQRVPLSRLPQPGVDYQVHQADGTPLPRHQWPLAHALRGEVVRNRQLTFVTTSGRHIPVLVQAAPLRDAQGTISRAVVAFQDVTRLREAEQLKDDFLSLVSHEMRTPLTAIMGGAQMLAGSHELDEETRRDLLESIVIESARLNRTLSNMLTLTSIQAGQMEPTTEPVLLTMEVRKAIAETASLAPGHRFANELPATLPPAEADPDLTGHVLRNLLENAAKYSPAGTTVHVTGASRDGQVMISVRDEGAGIAAEHRPHLFDRFRRPGADPTVRGMGLGLYLSRHLMDVQGGTLSVTSLGPGQGATFTLALPLAIGWDEDPDA
jgi:signal transduction histidine kinase